MPVWGDDAIPFLARVLPWPASEQDAGYGNIVWSLPNTTGKGPARWWTSKPFKSAAKAASFATWLSNRGPNDIYFCTSLQAQTTRNAKGKEIGLREISNTLGSKVLFIDIDVKAPPKGYPDLVEAKKALGAFVKRWKLPFPTALVESGGGLHAYWVSNRVYTKEEWQPMAESLRAAGVHAGLLFDGQCTVDIVRILRVPDTRNHKTEPPKPVKMIHLDPSDLDFDAQLIPALKLVPKLVQSPATRSTPAAASTVPATFDPNVFKKRAVPAAFAATVGDGGAIEHAPATIDTKVLFKGCWFLGEALRTGGEYHDQPQWNMAVLASTFLDNGRKIAHAMSNKHVGYGTGADTDDLYDRKEREKASKDMGWPSCVAIEQAGSKQCAGCPLRGTIRSPLNAGVVKPPPPSTPLPGTVTFASPEIMPGYLAERVTKYLPDGYVLDKDGVVSILLSVKDKNQDGENETREVLIPMFYEQRMVDPYLQEGPLTLHFDVDGNLGEMRHVHVQFDTLASPTRTLETLLTQGVAPVSSTKGRLGDFLMNFSRKLELAIKNIQAKPFGWIATDGAYTSFAYGGRVFGPNGSNTPGGFLDSEIKDKFAPIGVLAPWQKAADFLVSQKDRPDQHVVIAAAYAGPLMQFTGENLGAIHHCGDSAGGKSFPMMISQAVWGHPENARISKSSTENSIGKQMGTLSNITMNWDEVTENKNLDAMTATLMTNGQERGRLVAKSGLGVQHAKAGTWSTIFLSNSNLSLFDHIAVKQKDHLAGRYRVFEFRCPPPPEVADANRHWVTNQLLQGMRFNYGQAGMVYAKFLASRAADLPALVTARGEEFDALVKAKTAERFWSKTCACILLGAEFARDLGLAQFDLDLLRNFLVKTFLELRGRVESDGQQQGADTAIELITQFFKEHWQGILITDGVPIRGGARAGAMPFNILKAPMTNMARGIYVQFVARNVNPIVRIDRRKLNEWLDKNGHQPQAVYSKIDHRVTQKIKLGAGTPFVAGAERVMEIDVVPGDWLHDVMFSLIGKPTDDGEEPQEIVRNAEFARSGVESAILADAAIARAKDNAS